jgi:hypothetical protein
LLPFEHFLQPQPGGHGNPPQGLDGRIGQIEGHKRHAARLQDEVRGLQRALDGPISAGLTAAGGGGRECRGRSFAAHPEQAVQAHASGRHRLHVEHVEGVYKRRQLAPARRGRQHRHQEAGPARGARAYHFREVPQREASAKLLIQRGQACCRRFRRNCEPAALDDGHQSAVELLRPEQRFDISTAGGRHGRLLSIPSSQ